MKIPDLMETLKGCVQRQVHEMGRSVLSELKMLGTTSLPQIFHFKPQPLKHMCSIVYNRQGTCSSFGESNVSRQILVMERWSIPTFLFLLSRVSKAHPRTIPATHGQTTVQEDE